MTSRIEKPIDRATVRAMAEDFWRAQFARGHLTWEQAMAAPFQFTERVNALAAAMPDDQAQEFEKMMGEERDALIDELDRDPAAFRRRLG